MRFWNNLILYIVFLAVFTSRIQSQTSQWKIDSLEMEVRNQIAKTPGNELIVLEYMFDNGRYEDDHKIFIWRDSLVEYFTILSGLASTIRIDTTSNHEFIKYYIDEQLDTSNHYLTGASSHDFGYYLGIWINGKYKYGDVRDWSRGFDTFGFLEENELIKKRKKIEGSNKFIYWINRIDEYYRKLLQNE